MTAHPVLHLAYSLICLLPAGALFLIIKDRADLLPRTFHLPFPDLKFAGKAP
jgi:hypothetical protein